MTSNQNQSWIQKILNLLATVFSRKSKENSNENLVAIGDGKFNPGVVLAETLDSVGFQLAKLNVDPEDVTDVKVLLMLQLEVKGQHVLWVLSESVAGMSEKEVILYLAAKLVLNKTIGLDDLVTKVTEFVEKDGITGVQSSDYDMVNGEYHNERAQKVRTNTGTVSVMEKSMDDIVKDPKLKSKAQEPVVGEDEDFASKLKNMWGIKDEDDTQQVDPMGD